MFIPGCQSLDYGLWSIPDSIETRVGLKSEEFDLFSGHVEVGPDLGDRLVGVKKDTELVAVRSSSLLGVSS